MPNLQLRLLGETPLDGLDDEQRVTVTLRFNQFARFSRGQLSATCDFFDYVGVQLESTGDQWHRVQFESKSVSVRRLRQQLLLRPALGLLRIQWDYRQTLDRDDIAVFRPEELQLAVADLQLLVQPADQQVPRRFALFRQRSSLSLLRLDANSGDYLVEDLQGDQHWVEAHDEKTAV